MATQTSLEQENATLRARVAELETRLAQQQAGEEHLQAVLNNLLDAAYRRNLRTDHYDYLSPVIEQIVGWTAEEMSRASIETVLSWIHPADLPQVQQEIERTNALCRAAGRATGVLEYRFLTKTGNYRWLGDYLTVVAGDDGQPLYRLGAVRDITEQKQAEESLQESLAKLERLFEILPVGISALNHQRQVIKQNPALENIVGMSAEGLTRGDYSQRRYIRPDGSPMPPDEFASARVIRGEPKALNVETGIIKENGSLTWVSVSAVAVPFSDWSAVIVTQDITARKQAEQALQASQQNLAALIENTDAAIWSVDKQYRMIVGNQLYHRNVSAALGRALVPGESVLALPLPAAALDEWRGYYDRALAGETFSTEASTRFAEEIHTVEYRFNPIRTAEGQITGVTVFGRDITERKRAEKALRESEARFHGTLDVMQEGVLLIGWDWRYLYINRSAETQGRRPAEELLEKTVQECWPGFEATDYFRLEQKVMQERLPTQIEGPFTFPDGEMRWFHWNIQPAPEGLLIVTQDITERMRAEEQRARLAERLELATWAAGIGIWDWDIQNNRLVWDEQMYTLYGRQPHEFAGAYQAWLQGLHPDDRAASDEVSEQARRGQREYDTEFRVIWPNGSIHWLHAAGQVFFDASVQAVRMIGVNYDITARKQAEEELRHTLEELRRSNAELEQFAYVSSHDLQEPLRAVAGMVQLLQQQYQGRLDKRADEYIDLAVDGASRLQALINDLLAYSRVGRRRGKAIEPVDAGASLQQALRNLTVAITESQAIITSDPLPAVTADPTQLTQLFQNLIGNSLKFRGSQTPRIHIGAVKMADSWQFSVQDNGIGIEPQYFERIFLVFQRLHLRDDYPGTGIGLALCQKIVERHGGKIWVESQPGQGSTFYFTVKEQQQ